MRPCLKSSNEITYRTLKKAKIPLKITTTIITPMNFTREYLAINEVTQANKPSISIITRISKNKLIVNFFEDLLK